MCLSTTILALQATKWHQSDTNSSKVLVVFCIPFTLVLVHYSPCTPALCVVGNKCDLTGEREVPKDRGETFAHQLGALFTETSAAENMGKTLLVSAN